MAVLLLGIALATPAGAQTASSEATQSEGSFDGLLRALNLKATMTPPADFVQRTRPSDDKLEFMPVGVQHPVRPVKTMTPAEVAATTNELDAARMAQQRRVGLKPVAVPDKNASSAKVKTQAIH